MLSLFGAGAFLTESSPFLLKIKLQPVPVETANNETSKSEPIILKNVS